MARYGRGLICLAMEPQDIHPLRASFKVGWPSLVALGSIAVPILYVAYGV